MAIPETFIIFVLSLIMTTKVREYITKVPFSVHEWRKGQRYVLAKYTTEDVQIIGIKKRQEEDKLVTESHKILSMGKWLPGVVKKILNENALLVEEFATNIDVFAKGTVATKERIRTDGLLKEMKVEKEQRVKGKVEDPGEIESKDVGKDTDKKVTVSVSKGTPSEASTVLSTCDTSYVNKYYDANTFTLTVKTAVKDVEEKGGVFGTDPEKVQVFDLSKGREGCYVYKLITVTINSLVLGWIAERIKNSVRDMLGKFHEKVIETEDEWKDMKEEELVKLEEEMIKKFLKRV